MANADDEKLVRGAEAAVASAQRLATRIIEIPKDERDEAFTAVRRNMEDAMRQHGFDPATKKHWLDTYMGVLKQMIRDIEASGGGQSGHA